MAVTRKPVRTDQGTGMNQPDEAKVRAIIERGGSVATDEQVDDAAYKRLQLRLSPTLVDRIDAALRTRAVPPSRHHWILEAICEKLSQEEDDS